MKKILLIAIFTITYSLCFAQKRVLTDSSSKAWPELHYSKITANGDFITYTVSNLPEGRNTAFVKSTNQNWQKQIVGLDQQQFSSDGKTLFGILEGKLTGLVLGTDQLKTIAIADAFELFTFNSNQYLIFRDSASRLIIQGTKIGSGQKAYQNIKEYSINPAAGAVIVKSSSDSNTTETLSWINVSNGSMVTFYNGKMTADMIFNKSGDRVAFTSENTIGKDIWWFKKGASTALKLASSAAMFKNQKIAVDEVWQFSTQSDRLYFTLPSVEPEYDRTDAAPDVWSYQDKLIYAQYKKRGYTAKGLFVGRNLAVLNLSTNSVTKLLQGNEQLAGNDVPKNIGDLLMVESVDLTDKDIIATKDAQKSYYILDVVSLRKIPLKSHSVYEPAISPDYKYLTYYDSKKEVYECVEISTEKSNEFASSIIKDLYRYQDNIRVANKYSMGIFAWIRGTSHALMIGTFGIWEVDVLGKTEPRKLTDLKEADRKTFYYFCERPIDNTVSRTEDMFVWSMDYNTKRSSINKLNIGKKTFTRLYSGGFFWTYPYNIVDQNLFQKASNSDAFLLRLPNVKETPNFLFTKNFKTFDTLSNIHPEKDYNWLMSELHTYPDSKGKPCQGILYKPENFDSTKKYPVVFYFYQDQSKYLNQHMTPEPVSSGLNIPSMVSNGYLIFKPDIYIEKGKFGESALSSVNAAADHLSKYTWVDSNKLAISGHSLGGFEVNYIATHTARYAAALSGAAPSSMLNISLDVWGGDKAERRAFAVYGPLWMGEDFEDNPQIYIDNSPIFKAKNVRTPILFMHNESDPNVDFYHSIQFFSQLRHMGKPAWIVSYKGETHGIGSPDNQLDYQDKVRSFFDHYLMGKPLPNWMMKHIEF